MDKTRLTGNGMVTLGNPSSSKDRAEMRDALERSLKEAERDRATLKVPGESGRLQKHPGMHYHFLPEVFLQMRGATEFRCPGELMVLKPGEIGVMPRGIPHHETIYSDREQPFRNLVVGFYSRAISLHLAYEAEPRKPDIDVIEFFDAPNIDFFLTLVNGLVDTSRMSGPEKDRLSKGLLIALLALLLNLVEIGNERLNEDIGKVFQAKWLVREQISNDKLNVKSIAEKLQCSPDYLSHLFHLRTGETLIHYIQRIRIEGAILALDTTPLYISEIAWSSGFADPAYFARVFKKFTGMSPQEFRASREAERRRREPQPKTIYYDRVDYSAGKSRRETASAPSEASGPRKRQKRPATS